MQRRPPALVLIALMLVACAHAIRSTVPGPPTSQQMAEFWVDPSDLPERDLFYGAGGRDHAPDPAGRYDFVRKKTSGFSPGYTVKDSSGVEWSAKMGAEAQSEVVSSRLVWALGYHQPPAYYVHDWKMTGGDAPGGKPPARFRPHLAEMKEAGNWSWRRDPFVGTQPWKGLLVMMVMINNSDLKPQQNVIYELPKAREGARRWYVARDLGLSLGETGMLGPDRNDISEFEKEKFTLGVVNDRVRFNYSGLRKDLFQDLTPEDVRWTCERLRRLSPQQWNDAFRAAGYTPELAERFIRRFHEKIDEGLSLSAQH